MEKVCIKCGFIGEDILFVKRENKCKNCQIEYNKQYKQNHSDNRANYHKQYYKDNKERISEQHKQYYQDNEGKILERQTAYDLSHDSVSKYREQYRAENKEKHRIYYLEHKEKLSKYHNEYIKKRNKNDPAFRLRGICSRLVSCALSGKKSGKSILKYLPYTMEQLKCHIENQFDKNMSWENYGIYWQIDHVFPQSKLPYLSMEDDNFKKCWALENLRPLEKIANIRKGNKINNIVRNL